MKANAFILSSAMTISSLFSVAMAKPADANPYWSAPPIQSLPRQTDRSHYSSTAVDGTVFAVGNDFVSTQTADGNLFVTGFVYRLNPDASTSGMYVQVNCGEFRYRPRTAWVTLQGNWVIAEPPTTYGWRNFSPDSSFETVGLDLCGYAAIDQGLPVVWYR